MLNFRSLAVWSKAHQLTLDVYKLTETFPRAEMFGLTSQLRRASSSIVLNSLLRTIQTDARGSQAVSAQLPKRL